MTVCPSRTTESTERGSRGVIKMKPGILTRYILTITGIIIVFILLLAFSFQYVLRENSNVIREVLLNNNELLLLEKVEILVTSLAKQQIRDITKLSNRIRELCSDKSEFFYVIIYSKTADENYFKVQSKIELNRSIIVDIETNSIVKGDREENFIKRGLLKATVEPKIYSQNNIEWQSVFHPFKISKKNYVLEFLVSATPSSKALQDYSGFLERIKKYLIAGTALAVVIVLIISLLFIQNFTLLIKNISRSLKKAASGELDVNLNPDSDEELSELALSFNSLVDEIKELKEKEKIIQDLENKDTLGDIFKYGVNLLKEGQLDDAIIIFKSLILLKPESFGSFFNLGVAYAKKKNYADSYNMFWKALQFNPGNELTLQYIKKVEKLQESHDRSFIAPEE